MSVWNWKLQTLTLISCCFFVFGVFRASLSIFLERASLSWDRGAHTTWEENRALQARVISEARSSEGFHLVFGA
jgi:hypothetical protein